MIALWFPVFGVAWWILSTIVFIIICGFASNERGYGFWGGIGILGAFVLINTLFGNFHPFAFLATLSIKTTIINVLTYLGIGFGWSMFKWFDKLNKTKNLWKEKDDNFDNFEVPKMKSAGKTEEEIKKARLQNRFGVGKKVFDTEKTFSTYSINCLPEFKTSVIANWIILWPFSTFEFVFFDMIEWIIENVIKKIYRSFTNIVLGSYKKDFEILKEMEEETENKNKVTNS